MEKMTGKSMDLIAENIKQMKALFPEAVTEGKIDFEVLKALLGEEVEKRQTYYKFTWNGKEEARAYARVPSMGTLRPCVEESSGKDGTPGKFDSGNLYIEGDNLEVLKLLQGSYHKRVKMIYIDPPYNTGKDFVYPDDYRNPIGEYKALTGQIDSDGVAMRANSETSGRYHTDWLNMMYPRLILARNLLTDDGVIFISIDDNEQDNLKKICNEVFGEENFIAVFTRVTKKGGKSSESTAKNHDFLVTFAKNKSEIGISGVFHTDDGYSNKDDFFEQRGYYKANQTLDYDSLGYVKTLDYPISIDNELFYAGGDRESFEQRQQGIHGRADWGWRWSKELFEFGLRNGFIEIRRGGNRPRIYTKTYQNVEIKKVNGEYKVINIQRTKPLSTLEFTENQYSNDNAKKVFEEIMGNVFEYTKPPQLVKRLLQLLNNSDSIVLDFFSGSATTAHAVMQLNAEDGGNRKFIMVQLPEACEEGTEAFKAGYKNICEIGKERIRRAAKKIKDENPLFAGDMGFKVFKLDTSNIRPWNPDPDKIELSMYNSVENILKGRSQEDLLYEVLLKCNLPLTLSIEEKKFGENTVYIVGSGMLAICLDKTIPQTIAEEIVKLRDEYAPIVPMQVVFRDNGFTDVAKTNVLQILQQAGFEEKSVQTI